MGVSLLDHLDKSGLGLVGTRYIVEKDVLRRVGRINGTVRLVKRVLAGTNDRQRLAVRAELRSHRLARNEIGVSGQAGVQKLLNRAADEGRRDVLPRRQLQGRLPSVSLG